MSQIQICLVFLFVWCKPSRGELDKRKSKTQARRSSKYSRDFGSKLILIKSYGFSELLIGKETVLWMKDQ